LDYWRQVKATVYLHGEVHIIGYMWDILGRRCKGLDPEQRLFDGLSADHVTEMAQRAGTPDFTLHDLRKLIASVGARMGIGDAQLRRILGHAPKRGDVLHRHYVELSAKDVADPLTSIQREITDLVGAGLVHDH